MNRPRILWWSVLLLGAMSGAQAARSAGANTGTATSIRGAVEWQSSFLTRVEALALLQTLNADLLSHDSATATLERWCDAHHLASPARVVAIRVLQPEKAPSPQQRGELAVTPAEPIRYRRVRLTCGPRVLSEADNWYVPGRLTPEMNRLLETTDAPFGKVVRPLQFKRTTLSAVLLWSPLPDAWEISGAAGKMTDGSMPAALLEHRALLALPNGTPISEVVETYTNQILAFPPVTP